MGQWVGAQAGQSWPTFPKHVLFVTSPSENPTETKNFFFDFDYKTC